MSFSKMLNHACGIYHLQQTDKSPGYALPTSPVFSYPEIPDLTGVPCHFHINNSTLTVMQGSPQARLTAKVKLSLPIGADVRINDKVIDCETGYEYTAGPPRTIRDHHVIVELYRTGAQESL